MSDDIEHRTEVRSGRRTGPVLVTVALLAALAAFLLLRTDGGAPAAAPAATSSSAPTTTLPQPTAIVHVVSDTDAGPRPATTADAPADGVDGVTFEAIQATPVVTDDQIALLVDSGAVLAGRPGEGFRTIDVGPAAALIPSNEPGHVWVIAPADELALVDLDGIDPPVRIPLGGDRVLGPASFGVVTVSAEGAVSWRRPSFDATPVPAAGGGRAVDAGGDLVLVEEPGGPSGERVFAVLSVVDGSRVRAFGVPDPDRPAVLATDGTAVALPVDDGWLVRDSITGQERGSLPGGPAVPIWVGDGRFAVLIDGAVVLSDGTRLSPPWRLRDLAEQSP